LIEVYEKYGDPVLTGYKVKKEETSTYGMIDGEKVEENILQVKTIVEKPGPEKTPSLIASLGGFILTPDIFAALEATKLGRGGELWLVDAIFRLLKKRPIYARQVEGRYHDTGSKLGYLEANVEFALRDKKLGDEFRKYLKSVV